MDLDPLHEWLQRGDGALPHPLIDLDEVVALIKADTGADMAVEDLWRRLKVLYAPCEAPRASRCLMCAWERCEYWEPTWDADIF